MKRIKRLLLLLVLSSIVGCVPNTENTKNNKDKGVVEVCIDYGCSQPKRTEKCEDAFGMIMDNASIGQTQLWLQGVFPDKSVLALTLLWDGTPTNGDFSLNEENIGVGNWGFANYSFKLGETPGYSTIDESSIGKATITSFDEANRRISGHFSFTGKLFNGTAFENSFKSFSGRFENLPIMEPSNPGLPCMGGGGGNGGGGNSGGGGNNGGGGSGGVATVQYRNASFTPISIIVNNESKTIPAGSAVTFSGAPNAAISGSATTSGKTNSGTQVGLKVDWNLTGNFPATGSRSVELNIDASLFFLRVINNSGRPIAKLLTNYGLASQIAENLSIGADGLTYNLGYYKAFTNSNVRAESGNYYWQWSNLSLPFTINQSVTLTATP